VHSNEQLIHDFYIGFRQLDWQAMAACYHRNIHFSDPVFTELKGEDVHQMWRMLCSKAKDFELQYRILMIDDTHGSARCEASYVFAQTGRRVHNVIFAEFQFADGKIIRHSDHFSFWKWSFMALGAPGLLFGWSGFLRRKVQHTAAQGLAAFRRRN